MANRVLVGKRGSEFGLWVSEPGVDVLTSGLDQTWFDSDEFALGVYQEGSITIAANSVGTIDFSAASFDYVPRVLVACASPGDGIIATPFSRFAMFGIADWSTMFPVLTNTLIAGFIVNVTKDTLAIGNGTGPTTSAVFGYTIFYARAG